MARVRSKIGWIIVLASASALSTSQMMNIPEGWANRRVDGVIFLMPPTAGETAMFFTETLGSRDLADWAQSNFPELNKSQIYHLRAMNGLPVDVLLGNQKGTNKVFIATATPSEMGTKIVGFAAPDSETAAKYLEPLAKATDQWIGMRTQMATSTSGGGANAATGTATATGDHINAGATTVSGPAGSSASSSSSSQSSSSSTNSSQDANSNSSSNRDAHSQTSRDSNSSSNHDANSQTSKDFKSNRSSDSQIVYDPGTHNFKVMPGSKQDGQLRGTYSYVSDLFAAPIAMAKSSPQTQSQVMIGPQGFVVVGPGARAEGAQPERDGDTLILHFKNGEVLKTPMRILEVVDGQVSKFAIGPCVYTRNSS